MNKTPQDKPIADRLLLNLKNNKILAYIIVFGICIIGIGAFSDALNKISSFVDEDSEKNIPSFKNDWIDTKEKMEELNRFINSNRGKLVHLQATFYNDVARINYFTQEEKENYKLDIALETRIFDNNICATISWEEIYGDLCRPLILKFRPPAENLVTEDERADEIQVGGYFFIDTSVHIDGKYMSKSYTLDPISAKDALLR